METSNNQIVKYALNDFYRFKAKELTLLLEEGRVFLNKHKPSIGFWGESILRNFLKNNLPSKYNVVSGFVFYNENLSLQCDIIIYDAASYAPLAKYGDIEIIQSESVAAIIEVKNSIKHDTFQKTLNDFVILGQMGVQNKYLFIYSSIQPKTIESYFYGRNKNSQIDENSIVSNSFIYDHGDFKFLPSAIVSIQSNYILCQDLVVNDRDMYSYSAYQYIYPSKDGSSYISSLQLFLGLINDNCSTYKDDNDKENDVPIQFDDLKVIYNFGLWDL